jgi:mannose-6-phosphate isomerase-like protein (cupin superfamily)
MGYLGWSNAGGRYSGTALAAKRSHWRSGRLAYRHRGSDGRKWWLGSGRLRPSGGQRLRLEPERAQVRPNIEEEAMSHENWKFMHNVAADAKWTPGLREIFDYRDLGIKEGTQGDYVAHIVKANGKKQKDEVQHWHVHDCDFQFVYVLNGWAKFEYAGQGVRTIRKGDCINQRPGIPHREIECSEDFEVLEIVSPANFATRIVDAPKQAAE